MSESTFFQRGDVIVRVAARRRGYPIRQADVKARYMVLGYTTRGKLRLRRESGTDARGGGKVGTETRTWWRRPGDLPERYVLERHA